MYIYIYTNICTYVYVYICMYIYLYTYKLIIKVIVRQAHSRSGDSQGKKTFLTPSADKQSRNYDIECSNHHP